MANPPSKDQVIEGDKFGVSYNARTDCERGGVGVELSARVDAALGLMDLANQSCPLHKDKLCTYREDSGANWMAGGKVTVVEDTVEEGSGKLRKKKRKVRDCFSSVQSKKMDHNVGKEGNLHETCLTSDGHKLIIKLHKKRRQQVEAHLRNDFDGLRAPLLGSEQVTKKKKTDVQNVGRMVESDYDHIKFRRLEEREPPISSFKKQSFKKEKSDAGFWDNVVTETKPSKKLRFTSASPSGDNGFPFSIVHFLSAIRIAMITAQEEDDTKAFGKHLRKGNNTNAQMVNNLPSLTLGEIVERVRTNPIDPSVLEAEEPFEDLIRGALNIFSSKAALEGAKGWQPLALLLKSRKGWSWIGPVSSTKKAIKEQVSAEAWGLSHRIFGKLVKSFADWLRSLQDTLKLIATLPAPPFNSMQKAASLEERLRGVTQRKCITTISPCSEELRAYFCKEEAIRYSMPERAFSYTTVDGRKSTVAPLRRTSGKPSSKVRDHFMLKADRPPHVTILCLVRDAAARLPASMGTRSDVCTLLRDSQYIIENVSDDQLTQVVSRALDRLHYENDPCIHYNGETKLWVYLHREKDEEDFEDDGTLNVRKGNGKE